MRQKLKQLNGKRSRFTGIFSRFGKKSGWKGTTEVTVLLKDIKDEGGNIVCDHLWFNLTNEFEALSLKEGMVVSFDARVKEYLKGYKGPREDCTKPVEKDFRLSHPTKVQNMALPKYEINVRKLQELVL